MSYIQISNVSKKYGDNVAVNGISFEIGKGELFGLLGPNGAGKSTTISMMTGLLSPTGGDIFLNGKSVVKNPMAARKILGLVPQEIALYPTLTAKENLQFWGKMYNLSGKHLKQRVDAVLQIAGLEDRKNERIDSYSGGMKRRINIAAALLHQPEILIMDEPTVGIDPQSRNHILESVKQLNQEGMTVIYTSHYMEEIEYLCNRIGIVDHGKLIAIGEKENLKQSIKDEEKIILELSMVTPIIVEKLKKLPCVEQIQVDDNQVTILSKESKDLIANIVTEITKMNVKILGMKVEEPNLETMFLQLTGHALRD